MNPQETLKQYEKSLESQTWSNVAPYIDDRAIFYFSSGTFTGIGEIEAAFRRTFNLIQDEKYKIDNIQWLHETDTVASCVYQFHWDGIIEGKPASGGGRGTAVLTNNNGQWKILHEHLGPHPR